MVDLESLKASIPEYAKDLRFNLGTIASSAQLTEQQIWGAALASALASRQPDVIRAIAAEAERRMSPGAFAAAKGAAAIMGMNNVYYRFTHLTTDGDYGSIPARLRMQLIARPGVDPPDFDLWSFAASAVNGCGACMDSHARDVLAKGGTKAMVQETARIASIVHGIAVTICGERAIAGAGAEPDAQTAAEAGAQIAGGTAAATPSPA
ncbi:MAG: carboxymuconolactone decarboxylase family protein [Candidatus Eisenbacteria bacterium]